MTSLYSRGYRQGMILRADLAVPVSVWDGQSLHWHDVVGDRWLIATQDCDLDQLTDESVDQVELRLAEATSVPGPSGIRSRFFSLPDGRRLDGRSLRPLLPVAFVGTLGLDSELPQDRLLALKLWLGRRYDRPAVPETLVPLMRALAAGLSKGAERRSRLKSARDVFVDIDETTVPPRYALTAVCDVAAAAKIEEVLFEAANEIPAELGVLTDAVAVGVEQASIALLERTYVADLSDASIASGKLRGLPPV